MNIWTADTVWELSRVKNMLHRLTDVMYYILFWTRLLLVLTGIPILSISVHRLDQ